MIKLKADAGICGFTTYIEAENVDGQNVSLDIKSNCPNIAKVIKDLKIVDAYANVFAKPAFSGPIYKILGDALPHAACPLPSAILKAVEAAASLALKKDVKIEFED